MRTFTCKSAEINKYMWGGGGGGGEDGGGGY